MKRLFLEVSGKTDDDIAFGLRDAAKQIQAGYNVAGEFQDGPYKFRYHYTMHEGTKRQLDKMSKRAS